MGWGPHALAVHGQPDRGDRRAVLPRAGRGPLLRHREGARRRCTLLGGLVLLAVAAGDRRRRRCSSCSSCCTTSATCRRSGWPTRSRSTTFSDQEKQFPLIRVFGTIGWIVAGLVISFVLGAIRGGACRSGRRCPLYMAAVASLAARASISFTLPHTPPRAARRARLGRAASSGSTRFAQLGSRPFYVFIASSLLHLHPARRLLQLHPALPRRGGRREHRRDADARADVGEWSSCCSCRSSSCGSA